MTSDLSIDELRAVLRVRSIEVSDDVLIELLPAVHDLLGLAASVAAQVAADRDATPAAGSQR
jgi:hypothetical protein